MVALYGPLNHQARTIAYDTSNLYLIYISLLKLYLKLVSHYHGEMYGLESLLAIYFYIKNSGPLNYLRGFKFFKVSHKFSIASSVQASFLVFPNRCCFNFNGLCKAKDAVFYAILIDIVTF